jgi:hypothetical protein
MQVGSTCECRRDIVRAGSGVNICVFESHFVEVGRMIPPNNTEVMFCSDFHVREGRIHTVAGLDLFEGVGQ